MKNILPIIAATSILLWSASTIFSADKTAKPAEKKISSDSAIVHTADDGHDHSAHGHEGHDHGELNHEGHSEQATCPVMGEPINKKIYVEKNGYRIYVCCAQCKAEVSKKFDHYIEKLEEMGQHAEKVKK